MKPSYVLAAFSLFALGALGCEPTLSPGKAQPGAIGAPCAVAEDCTQVSSPICLSMGPEGYCASDCAFLGQFICPTGSVCEQLGDQAILCLDGCCSGADCRDGYRCSRRPELDIYQDLTLCPEPGICLLRCASDSSCSQGQVCDTSSGNCVPRVGVDRGVGSPCTAGDQCNSGTCLASYPGGYCTSPCGTQFTECEPGSQCYPWQDGTPSCMATCQSAAQCRAGYRCEVSAQESGGSSVRAFCVPRCDAFGDCPDGTSCDPTSGECLPGAAAPGPIGAFCQGSSDCLSGTCQAAWPNGYCTASCGTCPAGASCVDGACLSTCGTANDCRFGYVCFEGTCQPACTSDAECAGASICDTASGLCVTPSTGTVVQEFASQTIAISASGSAEMTFQVPANALSAVIHVDDGQQTLMAIHRLFAPGDSLLYDIETPALSRITFLPTAGTFTGMFPNSPKINLVPGSYRVRFLRESGSANATVRVFGKVGDGFPTQQELAVAFYFVGGPGGLTAASAPSDARFQQALSEMRTIYTNLGLDIGAPIYRDITGAASLRVIDTIDGPGSELGQLFRMGDLDDTLQFYFVDEIRGGDEGYVILGIAGGIPGPPGIARGPNSGVAVTVAGVIGQPQLLGQVMAHEGGHYLGLFHTSEATGTSHDPLPDTPQCPSSRDTNWDGYVSPQECAGFGADNFMFWAATGTSRATSPEQGRVVRRNPLSR